jgi:hypothetical protein
MHAGTITAKPQDWSAGQAATVDLQPGRMTLYYFCCATEDDHSMITLVAPFSSLSSNEQERHIRHRDINPIRDISRTT